MIIRGNWRDYLGTVDIINIRITLLKNSVYPQAEEIGDKMVTDSGTDFRTRSSELNTLSKKSYLIFGQTSNYQ